MTYYQRLTSDQRSAMFAGDLAPEDLGWALTLEEKNALFLAVAERENCHLQLVG